MIFSLFFFFLLLIISILFRKKYISLHIIYILNYIYMYIKIIINKNFKKNYDTQKKKKIHF